MKVLVACEYSGVVRDAFIARGHDAISCDLLETESPGPHVVGDVLPLLQEPWDIVIAHPPCTRLANIYCAFRNANSPCVCIENPVMHKHARERLGSINRQVVQPWWFGDKTFKATGYELHGLPWLVPTNKLTPPIKGTAEHKAWSWIHSCPPGPDRWKTRSRTPVGIARAMAEQWG